MVETARKPSSNRSTKERRNTLFRVLDGVLSTAHKKIHFHLIRHWFGTMQYHKKPDLIHVQKLLGHRNILATQIYINLEQALFREANDEYHVKIAETIEEATKLLAVGYEYVSTMDNKQIYRKRK